MALNTYLFEYPYDGRTFGLEIVADSQEEAEARFRNIGYGRLVGTLCEKIPAGPLRMNGLYVRLTTWWRNLWR